MLVFGSSYRLAQIQHRLVQYTVILDGYSSNKIYVCALSQTRQPPRYTHNLPTVSSHPQETTSYLPLLDEGAEFVGGHGHPMKGSEHVLALHILRNQPELPESHLVVLKVRQRHIKHPALQTIAGQLWGDKGRTSHITIVCTTLNDPVTDGMKRPCAPR